MRDRKTVYITTCMILLPDPYHKSNMPVVQDLSITTYRKLDCIIHTIEEEGLKNSVRMK